MIKFPKSIKIAILITVIGVLLQVPSAREASWAAPNQDPHRQTVPSPTPTPGSPTPTVLPPPATSTPFPTPTAEVTPTISVTESPTPESTEMANSAPVILPQAGSGIWMLWGGPLLLLAGALLLLAGGKTRRRNDPS